MTDKIADGGPAFPHSGYEIDGQMPDSGHDGMSLRAYIATAALQGLLAEQRELPFGMILKSAVAYADALIAELKKETK